MADDERTIDRTGWGPGPWDDEPDFDQFVHVATGLVCFARRSDRTGAWCGYVCVPLTHPALATWGARERLDNLVTHGGVTWLRMATHHLGPHVADPPAEVVLVGFDCSHSGDLSPRLEALLRDIGRGPHYLWLPDQPGVYRTLGFVREMLDAMAYQVAAIGALVGPAGREVGTDGDAW